MNMLSVFRNYFSHSTIFGFMIMAIAGLYYIFSTDLFFDYLVWFFIPIILAPFYEWYVHKYQLHKQLTKKDGWYRRYQIVRSLEIFNIYIWTSLSFIFINLFKFFNCIGPFYRPSSLSLMVRVDTPCTPF